MTARRFFFFFFITVSAHSSSHATNIMDNRDNLGLLESVYDKLQYFKSKRFFFSNCQKLGCLPKGLQLKFNLALGVNEPALVTEIEVILEKASSKIMDCLDKYCDEKEEELEEEFERLKEEVEVRDRG